VTREEIKYALYSVAINNHPETHMDHVLELFQRVWTLDELNDLADGIKSYCQDQDLIERLY